MESRQIVVVGAAVLILVASISAAAIFSQQKEPPIVAKPTVINRYVKTTKVKYKDVKTSVQAFGRVKTSQTLDVISEVGGKMIQGSVRLKDGVNFREGQLIYQIDDQEAALNLKSQKSNFLRDLANILPDLRLDFETSYPAWQLFFNSISMEQYLPDLPVAASEKEKTFLATKGIFSTYYTIRSAEVRLDKYKYYAPFAGSFLEVAMQSGSFVNPGTKIAKVMKSGSHELQVNVETTDIKWISKGSPATIFSKETQQVWEGVVTRVSDYVNQNTQSIDVFISINSGNTRVYDGQFLKADIPAETIKNGMAIPREAIYNGSEVFVVRDSLLKVHPIQIYRLSEDEVIIGGIAAGEDLVIEPMINAYNNMKVIISDQAEINMEQKKADEVGIAVSSTSSSVQ
ncbi:MAG: membrane fusion protein (multidrug efflux system) [Paraglaciecola sp.]|jgi:membrane fusion protein (multidrug efflux system)